MITNGFAKAPREIVNRPWFDDGATLTVYVFLLCAAAFKDIEREGYTIRKGQYITSVKKLSEACRLSIQQTRTALNHLKATHDITIDATSRFSVITVNPMLGDDDPNTIVNTLANTRVNTTANNRSRSTEENKKEEIKKEEYREEAAPPFTSLTENDNFVEELIGRYGKENVRRYEEKFRKWAEGKNTSKISMYPTIAKWLAEDIKSAGSERAYDNSSLDIDEFERKLLEQYMKNGG